MIPEIPSATDIFCHFGPFFTLLHPPKNQKNQNFKKLKKLSGYILILHKCTKNRDHMLHYFLDMARNGLNSFFPLGYFLPFYLPNNLKNEKLKKK